MIDLIKKFWLIVPLAVIAGVVFLSGCIEAGSTSGGADATGGSSTQTQEQTPAE